MKNCHRNTTDMQPCSFAYYLTQEYHHRVLGLLEVLQE